MRTPVLAALALALMIPVATDARVRNVTDPNAPRALEADGPVQVAWTDPAQFTEIRYSGNRWEARRGDWVRQLAEHLQTRAGEQLPEGERLDVTITDIRRAGDYEPGRGVDMDRIRIMRDIHWPRITLEFTRRDAAGNVIDQGERRLSDPSYLTGNPVARRHDPLRFEKALLDRWLRQELSTTHGVAATGAR